MEKMTYKQGMKVNASDPQFADAARAAVDYRGDVTLELANGEKIEGYVFSFRNGKLGVYPKEEQAKRHIVLGDVVAIQFTGIDKAAIRSFEDYEKILGI